MSIFDLIKKLGDTELARKDSYAHAMGVLEGILIIVACESPAAEEVVRKIVSQHLETVS